jgi:hypothetical protein
LRAALVLVYTSDLILPAGDNTSWYDLSRSARSAIEYSVQEEKQEAEQAGLTTRFVGRGTV